MDQPSRRVEESPAEGLGRAFCHFRVMVLPAAKASGLRSAVLASLEQWLAFLSRRTGRRVLTRPEAPNWRAAYSSGRGSYDMRRLRLKGLFGGMDGTNAYRVALQGSPVSSLFTQLATRVRSGLHARRRAHSHSPGER